MPTINWTWAIVLCRLSDRAAEPLTRQYFVDLFTQNGTGGIVDYWRAVSCGSLDLSNSRVFGWFDVGHSSTDATTLSNAQGSGARTTFVAWARDAATANGIDLGPFRNILALYNSPEPDHGADRAGGDVVIALKRATLFEFGFTCHEMGHGFGLQHSYAANPDSEYGDGWDVMSWQNTFNFPITFEETTEGLATVGLNAHNVEVLGAIPLGRIWMPPHPDFSERVTLDALGQSPIGNHGHLVAKIPPASTRPARGNSTYTIEFRRKTGWDQAIPNDAVLCHEVRANGLSYLQPSMGSSFVAGQTFTTPDPIVFVRVQSFDAAVGTALLRVWDIPDGSLRNEDSSSEVYQISGGTKRLVPPIDVLTVMGTSTADVKSVPDGGLASVPTVSRFPRPHIHRFR
jgi:hypothetical protein